jgi:hypothetical protein
MKKLLLLGFLFVCLFVVSGCTKAGDGLILSASAVKNSVDSWTVFTNPQFRYEFRFPKTWVYEPNDQNAENLVVYPKGESLSSTYSGAMRIIGFVNWQTNYDLKTYFAKSNHDLYAGNFAHEDITLNGAPGVWFKKVNTIIAGQAIDVIAFNLEDRIVEVQLLDGTENSKLVFNTLKFYGNKSLSALEVNDSTKDSVTNGEAAVEVK